MAFAQGEYAYGLSISIETLVNSMKNYMLSDSFRPLEEGVSVDNIISVKQSLMKVSTDINEMIKYIDKTLLAQPQQGGKCKKTSKKRKSSKKSSKKTSKKRKSSKKN